VITCDGRLTSGALTATRWEEAQRCAVTVAPTPMAASTATTHSTSTLARSTRTTPDDFCSAGDVPDILTLLLAAPA